MQSDYLSKKSILRKIGPSTPTAQASWWSATTNSPKVESWNASIMQSDYLGEKNILRKIGPSSPTAQASWWSATTNSPTVESWNASIMQKIISARKAFCVK